MSVLSTPLRALCALAAACLFLGGIAGLVVSPGMLYACALSVAGVFVLPAMFGGPRPRRDELPRIEDHLHRYRLAMLTCFSIATLLYTIVLAQHRAGAEAVVQQLASLGVALWLVAFVLMFFVAYYRVQRRMASGDE
ncbi:MAG TPA: hypothetical protein VFN10_13555 [Thermoanaerobaculia bacterium]|nr:hypothetical protein [Thermoanaerobaculia bacterium]